MESFNDIERMLSIENRDKKRTGNGIFGRATKVGKFAGIMRTPVDFLKGKEKKIYKGTGKVRSYNMYNEIMEREKFETFSEEEQKEILTQLRKKFSVTKIAKKWGVSDATIYNKWLYKFGMVTHTPRKRKKRKGNYRASETANTNLVPDTKNEEQAAEIAYAAQDAQAMVDDYKELTEATLEAPVSPVEDDSKTVGTSTFTFHYQETVAGRTAAKKLEKLALFLEDEDTEYEVLLQVKEKGE